MCFCNYNTQIYLHVLYEKTVCHLGNFYSAPYGNSPSKIGQTTLDECIIQYFFTALKYFYENQRNICIYCSICDNVAVFVTMLRYLWHVAVFVTFWHFILAFCGSLWLFVAFCGFLWLFLVLCASFWVVLWLFCVLLCCLWLFA